MRTLDADPLRLRGFYLAPQIQEPQFRVSSMNGHPRGSVVVSDVQFRGRPPLTQRWVRTRSLFELPC